MNGFVPGALALIVQCRQKPDNIGKTVTLMRKVLPTETIEDPDGHLWGLSNSGLDAWLVESANDYISHPFANLLKYAVIAECRLMPLSGDQSTIEQEQEQELTV